MKIHEKSIALVLPFLGGGTTRHAREMAIEWSKNDYNILYIESIKRVIRIVIYIDGVIADNFIFWNNGDICLLVDLLKAYNTICIHYHHIIDMPKNLLNLYDTMDVPMVITLHDYYTVCPKIKLTNVNKVYCGETGEMQCLECKHHRKIFLEQRVDATNINEWRNHWKKYLTYAKMIVVPSYDMKKRMKKYFPNLTFQVIENPELIPIDIGENLNDKFSEQTKKNVSIGLIGGITPEKGAEVLLKCATEAQVKQLPLMFVVFGEIELGYKINIPDNIIVLGKYKENEIYSMIRQYNIDYCWFPVQWPETYSYVLTVPIRLHIPVLGVNLGAIGERILRHKWGTVYTWNVDTKNLLKALLTFDYSYYKGLLKNYKIVNDHFPKLNDYYQSITFKNYQNSVDIEYIQKISQAIKSLGFADKIYNLKGYEIKCYLKLHPGTIGFIKTSMKVDFCWIVKYLYEKSKYYTKKKVY
jgi:hypothetical protein